MVATISQLAPFSTPADRSLGRKILEFLFLDMADEEQAAGFTFSQLNLRYAVGNALRYGMVGDDSTLNTAAMTRWLALGQQGVELFLPPGIYVTGQNLIYPGTRIRGCGERSVLKLAANQPKSTRILTTQGAALWNNAVDSPVISISDIAFDGNRANQGDYLAFEKEQQHHILIAANKLSAGRCRAVITRCFFKEGCADGVAVAENADVTVSDCTFFNIFRSSISMLGGYSKVQISQCKGGGDVHPSRMQAEIDTTGFGSSKAAVLLMDNCNWSGGLDIALDGGSIIQLDTVHFEGEEQCILNLDGNLTGIPTYFTATNCYFKIGTNASGTHRFFRYGHTKFIGCTFEYVNNTSHANLIQPSTLTNQSITFDGCHFFGDSSYHTTATVALSTATWASGLLTVNTAAAHGLAVNDYVELAGMTFATTDVNGVYRVNSAADSDTFTVAVPLDPGAVTPSVGTTRKRSALNALSSSADNAANGNQMRVINCTTDGSVDCLFDMQQGGNLTMDNNHVEAGLLYDAGAAASNLFNLSIGQYTVGKKHRQMCHVTGSVAGCVLRHKMTYVTADRAGFTRSGNLTGLSMHGSRLIYGSGAPATSNPGFIGDIWRRVAPTTATAQQYCCTVAGQSGASTTWLAETTLA